MGTTSLHECITGGGGNTYMYSDVHGICISDSAFEVGVIRVQVQLTVFKLCCVHFILILGETPSSELPLS